MTAESPYAARASALGYAYQFRYALHHALVALRTSYDWSIAIEAADDVEFGDGVTRELKQLKHRKPGESIGDASPDLWKTLRIWAEGVKAGDIDAASDQLILVTTACAASDSIASMLSSDDSIRDVDKAKEELDKVARTSKNKDNKKAYDAWGALSEPQKSSLIRAVTVVCQNPDIIGIDGKIKEVVRVGNRARYIDAFVERLEGWWFRRCIEQLSSDAPSPITAEEIDGFYNDLREKFGPNNLPVDEDIIMEIVSPDIEEHIHRTFVKQIQLVGVSSNRLQDAIRDYLRAFTQRSRWSRNNLLGAGELALYERRLHEEWRLVFERLIDEMADADDEAEKRRVAKKIYAWVEDAAARPIRPECTEPFVTRGSLHMLADTTKVGWHPDFAAKLSAILAPVASAT